MLRNYDASMEINGLVHQWKGLHEYYTIGAQKLIL